MSETFKTIKLFFAVFFIFLIIGQVYCQIYILADPYNLLLTEKSILSSNDDPVALITRPIFRPVDMNNNWSLKVRSEFFYNSDAPNLENMSDRWVGKGVGFFSSVNVAYRNQYLAFSAEPYYYINQNDDYVEPDRSSIFSILNDNRSHRESPYIAYGIRELQFYLNYYGIGAGYSNANMWWGPGLHTSITMTNNTSGFGHLFLGTIEEKRYKNWGFSGRYIFSKLDKKSTYEPYYTAAVLGVSYYSEPIISIGIIREALTGGTHPKLLSENISWQDAALSIFRTYKTAGSEEYIENWSFDDQAATAYVSMLFKKSKLNLFLEIGRTDVTSSGWVLLVYPDHSIATNLGFRKYGLFGNKKLFFGCEYFQNHNPRSTHRILGSSGAWYEREMFDYSSYNGRRWVAHSGTDSDDVLLMFGWLDDNLTILPSFNYERHRVRGNWNYGQPDYYLPETKLEFRLDLRYKYKAYKLNLYYEREVTLNLESRDKTRGGNVIWVGIEKDISNDFVDKVYNKIFSN